MEDFQRRGGKIEYRRIEFLRVIRRRKNHNAGVRGKPVQLVQEECSILFIDQRVEIFKHDD
jgi:hypothetical protein